MNHIMIDEKYYPLVDFNSNRIYVYDYVQSTLIVYAIRGGDLYRIAEYYAQDMEDAKRRVTELADRKSVV